MLVSKVNHHHCHPLHVLCWTNNIVIGQNTCTSYFTSRTSVHLSPNCFHIHGTVPLQTKSDQTGLWILFWTKLPVWKPHKLELKVKLEPFGTIGERLTRFWNRDYVLTRHPHYHKHPKSTKWQKKTYISKHKVLLHKETLKLCQCMASPFNHNWQHPWVLTLSISWNYMSWGLRDITMTNISRSMLQIKTTLGNQHWLL